MNFPKSVLLYYPAINIPNADWIRKSLLYTDAISSIVPYENMRAKGIDDQTKLLFDEDLYIPISVFNGIKSDSSDFRKFEKSFFDVVQSDDFKNIKQESNANIEVESADYSLYLNKLTPDILEYLEEQKMISYKKDGQAIVEINAACIYMALLSDYLARNNKNDVTPSTDEPQYERLAFMLSNNKTPSYKIDFQNCLPTPTPEIEIKKIIAFKKKRQDEFLRFRLEVQKLEVEILKCNSNEERKDKMQMIGRQFEKELIELRKLYKDFGMDSIKSSFQSLLNFKPQEILNAGAVGIVTDKILEQFPVDISNIHLLGIGGTLILANTFVSNRKKLKSDAKKSALSYIYYGERAGIFK